MNPIIVIVIVVILLVVLMYNNLNSSKQRVEKSFATIDTYLQERTVKMEGLLDQALTAVDSESDMHKQVAAMRSGINNYNNASINDKVKLDNQMRNFYVAAESYPEFRSIDLFKTAAQTLIKDEQKIGASRSQYNKNVTSYNIKITSFPTSILANMFGFNEKFELFTLSEEQRQAMSSGSTYRTGGLDRVRSKNGIGQNNDSEPKA